MRIARTLFGVLATAVCGVVATGHSHAAEEKLTLWHTQGGDNGRLLHQIIEEYNQSDPPMRVDEVFKGAYEETRRVTRTNLIAKSPPDMAVAYESMVLEYMELGNVADLGAYLDDSSIGLSPGEKADFFPAFLELNRHSEIKDALISFPFTKSMMSLYANLDLLKQAGFSGPPKTWAEFSSMCTAVKSKLGKEGYAMSIDASTLDGMFMSRGAELYDPKSRKVIFDDPRVIETFEYLRKLKEAGGLTIADRQSEEDTARFTHGDVAFFIRSSTRRPALQQNIAGAFLWSMNPLPAGPGLEPMTVLYGGNICVFPNSEERARACWQFIKFFSSPEITARWAVGSGYLPVRRSAADSMEMQRWFAESPMNRQAFDLVSCAREEPNPKGWQDVRAVIEAATTDILLGRGGDSAAERVARMQAEAEEKLAPAGGKTTSRGVTSLVLVGIAIVAAAAFTVRRTIARR